MSHDECAEQAVAVAAAVSSFFLKTFAFIALTLVQQLSLPAAEEVIVLEGRCDTRVFTPDGELLTPPHPTTFRLLVSGCKWHGIFFMDTNQPGACTELSYDGSDFYIFVPDASGKDVRDGNFTRYSQSGSVRPRKIKTLFNTPGAIWWAYCSGCVLTDQKQSILDFLNVLGGGDSSTNNLTVEWSIDSKRETRTGRPESWAYYSQTDKPSLTPHLVAHLEPLSNDVSFGLDFVTKYKVTTFYPPAYRVPQVCREYLITITNITRQAADETTFVPEIKGNALISDYRTPFPGQYVSTNWLTAEERHKIARAQLIPSSSSVWSANVRRLTLIGTILLISLLFLGPRLWNRGKKQRTETTHL